MINDEREPWYALSAGAALSLFLPHTDKGGKGTHPSFTDAVARHVYMFNS